MSKKLIITLSVVLSVVAVVLILFWTLFALSSVSVEYHSTTLNLKLSDKEIIDAGGFHYGGCVIFDGKKKYEKNLQNAAKENPNFAYLRVLNIETIFPNKMVIHIAEREELFAIEKGEDVLICDRDLRVLCKNPLDSRGIKVKGLTIKNEDVSEGDFLEVEETSLLKFYSVMLQSGRNFNEQVGKFSEINLSAYVEEISENNYYSMKLTTQNGLNFVVNNPDFAFLNKVQLMFSFESTFFSNVKDGNVFDAGGNQIFVKKVGNEFLFVKQEESESVALTVDLLSKCSIKVDNLPLDKYLHRTENDVYCSLILNENL